MDALMAEINLKRKAMTDVPAATRPTKYMRKGDLEEVVCQARLCECPSGTFNTSDIDEGAGRKILDSGSPNLPEQHSFSD